MGDQRRLRRRSSRSPRAPTKASRASSSRRSPARVGGITVSENIGKLGYKGVETVEMSYADHRVPASAPRGRARPWADATSWRARARPHEHRRARRRRRASRLRCRARVRATARHDGQADRQHQAIQIKLADMATKLEAARLLTHSAAEKMRPASAPTSRRAWPSSSRARPRFEVATEAMRIHGGVGYTTDLPIERYYRDAPADDHRRGHQRDPATRHRPRAARPQSHALISRRRGTGARPLRPGTNAPGRDRRADSPSRARGRRRCRPTGLSGRRVRRHGWRPRPTSATSD